MSAGANSINDTRDYLLICEYVKFLLKPTPMTWLRSLYSRHMTFPEKKSYVVRLLIWLVAASLVITAVQVNPFDFHRTWTVFMPLLVLHDFYAHVMIRLGRINSVTTLIGACWPDRVKVSEIMRLIDPNFPVVEDQHEATVDHEFKFFKNGQLEPSMTIMIPAGTPLTIPVAGEFSQDKEEAIIFAMVKGMAESEMKLGDVQVELGDYFIHNDNEMIKIDGKSESKIEMINVEDTEDDATDTADEDHA